MATRIHNRIGVSAPDLDAALHSAWEAKRLAVAGIGDLLFMLGILLIVWGVLIIVEPSVLEKNSSKDMQVSAEMFFVGLVMAPLLLLHRWSHKKAALDQEPRPPQLAVSRKVIQSTLVVTLLVVAFAACGIWLEDYGYTSETTSITIGIFVLVSMTTALLRAAYKLQLWELGLAAAGVLAAGVFLGVAGEAWAGPAILTAGIPFVVSGSSLFFRWRKWLRERKRPSEVGA